MIVLTDAFLTKCATKLTILADITKHPATSMPGTLSKIWISSAYKLAKTVLVTKNCCNFAKRLIIREKNHVKAV